MATLKQDMEDECMKLQETLRHLMDDRSFIQDEFLQLTELQQKMMVQLRSDTLAGEGQLHTFQAEKNRIEDRLEQLERQLKEKNDQLLELDAKASEYLRKVTSVSNNLYDDDDEPSEQNVSQRNLIQKLIKDEMTERSDDDACSDRSQHGSAADDVSIKNIPSLDNDDSEGNEGDVSSESLSDVPSDSKPDRSDAVTPPTRDQIMSFSNLVTELKLVKEEMGRCITNKDETLLELEERLRETKRELASLKGSVSDVSFGMMRHRDESFFPLGRASSADNRKYELERHVSELQDATGQSSLPHDEKLELLQKIEILESLIDEDNSDLEVDDIMGGTLSRGRSVDPKDFLSAGMLRVRTPSIRSSSVMGNSSISERVAMLEKDLAEANEKLHHAHCHMHVIAKEKEHKQKECERLQSKVHNVEGKMSELQGTFDALVKTMMEEREQLVKEVEDRKSLMEEVKKKLEEQKTSVDVSSYVPRAELDKQLSLMEQKYCNELKSCKDSLNILEAKHADEVLSLKQTEEEMNKTLKSSLAKAEKLIKEIEKENEKAILELKNNFKTKENEYILKLVRIQKAKDVLEEESNQIQNEEFSVLQTKFDQLQQEMSSLLDKEMSHQATISNLREQLNTKRTETLEFCEKIKVLENEISDFAPHMKEEMARMKDECDKLTEDKLDLEKTYLALQGELKEVQQKNEELSLRLIHDVDGSGNIATLQNQIEDLNVKNVNLTSEMYTKEEESNEELNAREGTIQELRITLTNNQKQSRENYQMLQDDIAALNLRFAKEKEELQAIVVHLKEKCLKLEEDGQQKQQEVDTLKNSLEALQSSLKRPSEEILKSPRGEEEEIEEEPVETADKSTSIEGGVIHFPRAAPLAGSEEVAEEASEPEEDYHRLLSVKEAQISELSQKVEYLEKQLLKDSNTSDLKDMATDDELKSRFEVQMKQIAELNNFINDLQRKVDGLTSESSRLKETVDQLQTEKLQFEEEKKSLIANYEAKLIKAKHSQDALESELTSTKALIEECETKIAKTKYNKKALEVELEAKKALIAECEAKLTKSKDSQEALKSELYAKKAVVDECETKLNSVNDTKQALATELEAKKSVIDECEKKLFKAKNSQEALEAELGAKKNLVEGINFKLRSIEGSVLNNPCDVEISLIDRLDMLGTYYDKKIKENNEKYLTKINIMDKQILELKAEINEFQLKGVANAADISQQLAELEAENKLSKKEDKNLIESHEKEQAKLNENNEKHLTKIALMDKQILALKEEIKKFQLKDVASTADSSQQLAELEAENKLLKLENKDLIESHEKEQAKFNQNNEKHVTKIASMDKLLALKEEIDEFQLKGVASTMDISQQIAELKAENKLLKKENKGLIESHEKEQAEFNENNEKYLTNIASMDKQILALKEEIDEFQLKGVASTADISQQFAEFKAENKLLKKENKGLIESHEKEQAEFNENNKKYLTNIAAMDKQILALKEEIYEFQLKGVANTADISKQFTELKTENKLLKKENKSLIESHEKEQAEFNENNEKYMTKITIMDKQILGLKEEIDEFQLRDVANTVKISRQLTELENENRLLKQEKKSLIVSHEKEQTDTLNMQNQMVTDLEKLILNLESEKKELESELKCAQEQLATIRKEFEDKISVLRESILMLEKERDVLRMEIARLVENQPITDDSQGINSNECLSLIEDLTKKVTKLRTKLEEAQASLEEKGTSLKERLTKERTNHRNEMQRLRKDMRDEMDILEQQKEDLRIELTNEVKRLMSEWSARLKASEREKELQLMDEKSQFGRVLVGKNDEYEKMVEEKNIVVSGYVARLNDLQAQLEEKSNLIDELETNIEELVAVRENLEEKLSDFKSSPCSTGKFSTPHSPVVKAPKLSYQPLDPPSPHHTPPSPHS